MAALDQLKELRRKLAAQENVPAYIVLSDATLVELATYLPLTKEAFGQIAGFGEVKLAKYGEAFWNVVAQHCKENNLQTKIHLKAPKKIRKEKTERLSDTKIETHLAWFVEQGDLFVEDFVSPDKFQKIKNAVQQHGDKVLSPIKESLGDSISYSEIKMVLAHLRRTVNG